MSWYRDLSALVVARIGVLLPPEPSVRLDDAVTRRVTLLALGSKEAYVERVRADQDEWQSMLHAILNNRTWFYRDAEQLRIVRILLEQLARKHRELRVWSAGCSTGEEAYTIAMLMIEAGVSGSVLGTDLSADCVDAGQVGSYPHSAVRALPHHLRSRFLEEQGPSFRVCSELKARVELKHHNLVERIFPRPRSGGWHLIVCRNVFLYFEPRVAQATAERLAFELEMDGALVLGGADSLIAGEKLGVRRVEDRLVYSRREARTTSSPSLLPVSAPPQAARVPKIRPSTSAPWLIKPPPPSSEAEKTDRTDIVSVLESEVEAHPLRPDLRLALGAALSTEGQKDRAALELKRAFFLDPACWPAAYLLAGVYRQQGKTTDAMRLYENALGLLTRDDALPYSGIGGVELDPREVARACRAALGPSC
jgi:chemotaxis protein methyltransferase CheR